MQHFVDAWFNEEIHIDFGCINISSAAGGSEI